MANYDGTIKFDTAIDDRGFKDGLSKLKNAAGTAAAAVGAALAAGIGASVKVGMNFEAAMSEVEAISGATGEALAALTSKAEEMGAKTKFSASESAEALKYMAMAGWKTEDMLGGIEGVMNLAAASGENLGSVSDIVTDAITAFGLAASDSAHFADVLAAASSNANTNVGMMGETFKYAAPVAGAMGFSIEDTAKAIGLMANAGIKGSQAGTALRSVFTRLAKPPKEAAEAIKALGLNITKADGSFKELSEIMDDLRGKFSKLTAEQKTQYAAMLGGQEAMSGLLAIVNASQSDYDKLTAAIENSDGAAQSMAETMQDNLKGQLVILGSSLEGLGLAVYDGIQAPLKEAAKSAITSVNTLTASFKNGELKGALANVGQLLGGLVTVIIKVATVALPPLINAVSFIGKHLNVIVPAVTAAAGVWGIYTAATNAATIATGALNAVMALNPIVLVVAAVAALTAGIWALVSASNVGIETTTVQSAGYEQLTQKVNDNAEAFAAAKQQREESMNADLAHVSAVQSLYSELDNLTDSEGRVAEADRARAAFIVEQVNSIIPGLLSMQDNQIKKNKEIKQSIEDVMNAKKAQIILEAEEENYAEAIKNIADAQKLREQTAASLAIKESELLRLEAERQESIDKTGTCDARLNEQIGRLKYEMSGLTGTLEEQTKTYQKYSDTITQYESDYEALQSGNADAVTNIINRTSNAYKEEQLALAKSEEEKRDIYAKSLIDTRTHYELLKQEMEAGSSKVTQAQVDAAKEEADKAYNEFYSSGGYLVDGIIKGVSDKGGLLNKSVTGIVNAAVTAAKKAAGIHSPSRIMRDEVGRMLGLGVAEGIADSAGAVKEASASMFNAVIGAERQYNAEKARLEEQKEREHIDILKAAADKEKELREREFDNLKKALELELITEDEYYTELEKLRDKYFSSDSEEWRKYTYEIAKWQKSVVDKQKEAVKAAYDDMAKEAQTAIDDILSAQNALEKKLAGYGDLYTTVTHTFKGAGEHGEDVTYTETKLRDLSGDIAALREYNDALTALRERGTLPEGFFDELRGMDIDEGTRFANELLKAKPEDYDAFMASYAERAAVSKEISKNLYSDDMREAAEDAAANAGNTFMEKLRERFGDVPDDFLQTGEFAGQNFSDGFLPYLNGLFESFRLQMAEFAASFAPAMGGAGKAGAYAVGGNSYHTTYKIQATGQTVASALADARAADAVDRLRGKK